MSPRAIGVAVAGVVLAAAGAASAHTMSDGHLALVPDGDRLVGTLDVAVRDLHDSFGLDGDGDGRITWAEVGARRDAIASYVVAHLAIKADDGACTLAPGAVGVIDRPDGAHVSLALVATCPSAPADVTVDYHLLYELDAQHRGLLHVGDGSAIAQRGAGPVTITVRSGPLPRFAAAVPGGICTVTLGGAALALLIAVLLLRRTSRLSLVMVLAIGAAAAAPVGWALHRLVA